MPSKITSIPEAGLTVLHGAIDPSLIQKFEEECMMLFEQPDEVNAQSSPAHESVHDGVDARTVDTGKIALTGFEIARDVLRQVDRLQGYKATINHQRPGGKQQLHGDSEVEISPEHPMIVIQATDGGVFRYAPNATNEEEAEEQAIPLDVNAGDIIVQTRPDLIHGGSNPSKHDRYNMVLWRMRPKLTLEEAVKESANDSWE